MGGRSEQQDRAYVCCNEQNIFAVLCDGMGGSTDGGIASDAAIAAMRRAYKEYILNEFQDTPPSFLYRAMLTADQDVSKRIDYKAGGTTLVTAFIQDDLLYWLSVGDSRLYVLRSGELLQVTRDHNYRLRLNELKARGEITDIQYKKESKRGEALISYIGLRNITLFDLTQTGFKLQSGDRLLLATDGLFKVLSSVQIKTVMDAHADISVRADSLIKQVLGKSTEQILDNTTFIIIDAL